MSEQIAVRLPDATVEALDEIVRHEVAAAQAAAIRSINEEPW